MHLVMCWIKTMTKKSKLKLTLFNTQVQPEHTQLQQLFDSQTWGFFISRPTASVSFSGFTFVYVSVSSPWSEVTQPCPILCDPVDCNLLDFSIHGILQARILEWIAISFSRGSSRPRDQTRVSRIGGRRFNLWATRELYAKWTFVNKS